MHFVKPNIKAKLKHVFFFLSQSRNGLIIFHSTLGFSAWSEIVNVCEFFSENQTLKSAYYRHNHHNAPANTGNK